MERLKFRLHVPIKTKNGGLHKYNRGHEVILTLHKDIEVYKKYIYSIYIPKTFYALFSQLSENSLLFLYVESIFFLKLLLLLLIFFNYSNIYIFESRTIECDPRSVIVSISAFQGPSELIVCRKKGQESQCRRTFLFVSFKRGNSVKTLRFVFTGLSKARSLWFSHAKKKQKIIDSIANFGVLVL